MHNVRNQGWLIIKMEHAQFKFVNFSNLRSHSPYLWCMRSSLDYHDPNLTKLANLGHGSGITRREVSEELPDLAPEA